jgi:hypothetical protein
VNSALESELRDLLISSHRVVPIIGSGVSTATAGIPGWKGIIDHARAHIETTGLGDDRGLALIQQYLSEGKLTDAAYEVMRLLGSPAGEYPNWLKRCFGVGPKSVRDRSLINRIVDLRTDLLATTNYDKLLSQLDPGNRLPITWMEPVRMQTALVEGGCVFHLHGVFDAPESVIFGINDYNDLVKSEAYQVVLRDLWLNRVLLFVGCSFDGLQDPDFTRLLEWASRMFRGSPYKHYALLRNRDFGTRDARKFLLEYRVQAVGYGDDYDELPDFLARINPHREAARANRLLKLRALADEAEVDIPLLTQMLESVGERQPDNGKKSSFASLAATLATQHLRTTTELRTDLEALQILVRTMVDVTKLKEQISWWYANKRTAVFAGEFRKVALAASGALFLFPRQMLSALKRRRVAVHENVLSGYCAVVIQRLEKETDDSLISGDAYNVENANRVLTTLDAIMEVTPAQLFFEQEIGIRSEKIIRPALLVVRTKRLELRNANEPSEILATLPVDLELLGGAIVELERRSVVVAYNRERVFASAPEETGGPVFEFSVDTPFGINRVAHRIADGKLESIVVTTDGPVHRLSDLRLIHTYSPFPRDFFQGCAILQSGQVFVLPAGPFALDEITPDGEVRCVVSKAMLDKWVLEIANINPDLKERLNAERQRQIDMFGKYSDSSLYQHASVSSLVWREEPYLALRVCLDFMQGSVDLIILCQEEVSQLRWVGYYENPNRMTGYTLVSSEKHGLRIFAALLSKFDLERDLLQWSRSVPTNLGLLFVTEGSSVRIYDDLVGVAIKDDDLGFAFDDSGGLFRFTASQGDYEEIDRDKSSRIRDLDILPLKSAQ